MYTITIELPDDTFRCKVNGVVYETAADSIPNASLAKAFQYGWQRLVNDRHGGEIGEGKKWSSAESKNESVHLMLKDLAAGIVSHRGVGEESIMRFVRQVVRDNLNEKQAATYKAIKEAARKTDYLNDLYGKADDTSAVAIASAAGDARDADIAYKAAKTALAAAVTIKL